MFKGNEYTLPFRFNREEFLEFFLAEGVHERSKIRNLSETDKTEQINLIVRRIIESIDKKIDLIDMRSFDKSRGDITKVNHYQDVSKAIKELKTLTGSQEIAINKLQELENNLVINKKEFMNGYSKNKKMIKWLYVTGSLNLYYGTMLAIAHVADIVQDQNNISIQPNLKSQISRSYLFNNIDKMNELFRTGKAKEIFNSDNDIMNEDFGVGATLLAAAGIIGGLIILVYLIRESIMFFFRLRKSMTREFKIVSDYLELNKALTSDKKIAKNQEKLAKSIQKLSDMIAIENDTAEANATPEVRREINTEYKELGMSSPPLSGSASSSTLL